MMATKEEIANNLNELTAAMALLKDGLNTKFEALSKMIEGFNDRLGSLELAQAGMKQMVSESYFNLTSKMDAVKNQMAAPPPPPPTTAAPADPYGSAKIEFSLPMDKMIKAFLPDMDTKDPDSLVLALKPNSPDVLSKVEKNYMKSNQKINAIKEFRHRTGMGLKEAKDAVEAWAIKTGLGNVSLGV